MNYSGDKVLLHHGDGYYGQIKSRSGLAVKGIDVAAATIDSDYRGIIYVLLVNLSDDSFQVNIEDRIAELVIFHHYDFKMIVGEKIDTTNHSDQGFGSTGTK